ncbi:MAG: sulfatase [Planctomycetales bacterium]|nr:sulfatase [Planctomycetales bacterium]
MNHVVRYLCCILTCLLSVSLAPVAWAVAKSPPNILVAFADDWGRFASAYARLDGPGSINDVVQTPNFDRVAREGILFRRAFVSAPSCTPCRSALLSGQHFWRTGRAAILRGAVWDGSNAAYPLMLRDAGYHIGETYKVWSPGTPGDAPYGAGKYAYEKAGGRFNQFSENVTKMVADGQPVETARQALYAEVLGNFNAFLGDRRPDQPFCYWFGPTNVHRKWIKGSGQALWGIDPDSLRGKMPPFLADVPEMRQDLTDYFGEVQAFDAALGVLLKRLEEIGELDNTLIVVSGDHGAPGFPHGKCNLYDFGSSVSLAMRWGSGAKGGRVVDDLISLTDLAPTFLELGKVAIPDAMTGRSLLGVLTSEKTGQIDPRRTAVFVGRERHVENARADFMPYPQRAIRTHDFLYIINFKPDRWPLGDPYRLDGNNPPTARELTEETRVSFPDDDAGPAKAWLVGQRNDPQWKRLFELAYARRPREELYDLKSDPHQVANVAGDSKYARVRAEMEQRLLDELRRTGDPRLVDDGKFFETPPMAGPVTEDRPAAKKKGQSK